MNHFLFSKIYIIKRMWVSIRFRPSTGLMIVISLCIYIIYMIDFQQLSLFVRERAAGEINQSNRDRSWLFCYRIFQVFKKTVDIHFQGEI